MVNPLKCCYHTIIPHTPALYAMPLLSRDTLADHLYPYRHLSGSRNRAARQVGSPHLGQYLVKPLERPVQLHLDPAGGGSDVLTGVLRPPTLHEGYPEGAHPGQLVDRFKTVTHLRGRR